MLAATGGVNTHRGAIFNLGLLCAAAGQLIADGEQPSASACCETVQMNWGAEILHGYGSGGARQEAASGFPAALALGLPAYRSVLAAHGDGELAATQALFALMSELDDTNLLWRGGQSGLAYGQRAASEFLAAGGVFASDWRDHAEAIDRDFIARRLSPGGSADLLGVTLFLAELDNWT